VTFTQPPIRCPECGATGGLHTLSCTRYPHANEPPGRLTDAELAELKRLVPWQWEDWHDPYERGTPLCEIRQDHLRALLDELEELRRR